MFVRRVGERPCKVRLRRRASDKLLADALVKKIGRAWVKENREWDGGR